MDTNETKADTSNQDENEVVAEKADGESAVPAGEATSEPAEEEKVCGEASASSEREDALETSEGL